MGRDIRPVDGPVRSARRGAAGRLSGSGTASRRRMFAEPSPPVSQPRASTEAARYAGHAGCTRERRCQRRAAGTRSPRPMRKGKALVAAGRRADRIVGARLSPGACGSRAPLPIWTGAKTVARTDIAEAISFRIAGGTELSWLMHEIRRLVPGIARLGQSSRRKGARHGAHRARRSSVTSAACCMKCSAIRRASSRRISVCADLNIDWRRHVSQSAKSGETRGSAGSPPSTTSAPVRPSVRAAAEWRPSLRWSPETGRSASDRSRATRRQVPRAARLLDQAQASKASASPPPALSPRQHDAVSRQPTSRAARARPRRASSKCAGNGVCGRQSVIGCNDTDAGKLAQPRQHSAMGPRAARHIAAAVKIEDRRIVLAPAPQVIRACVIGPPGPSMLRVSYSMPRGLRKIRRAARAKSRFARSGVFVRAERGARCGAAPCSAAQGGSCFQAKRRSRPRSPPPR